MGTVTKVMFGLIILAGGGGIFMALSMIPGKVEKLQKDNETSVANANVFKSQVDGLNKDLSTSGDNLKKVTAEKTDLKTKYDSAMQGQKGAQKLIDDANQAKALAESDFRDVKQKYDADQPKLNALGKAQADLSAYNRLSFKGQGVDVATIQNHLDELEAIKKKKNTKNTQPVAPPKKLKGLVGNVDPLYGFVTIDIGEKDTKKKDVYRVTRGGKFVGTIFVHAMKGDKSYCQVDKTRTTGMDKNPKTGDIQIGDDVELSK
jgi:hypothetical protein